MYEREDRTGVLVALAFLALFVLGGTLIFFNSKGDYKTETYRAGERCVEFTSKSNGWDYKLVKIEDC